MILPPFTVIATTAYGLPSTAKTTAPRCGIDQAQHCHLASSGAAHSETLQGRLL